MRYKLCALIINVTIFLLKKKFKVWLRFGFILKILLCDRLAISETHLLGHTTFSIFGQNLVQEFGPMTLFGF